MKKSVKYSLALVLVFSLAASGIILLSPSKAQAVETTLKIAQAGDPITLDPYDSWDSASNDVIVNIYDTLVMYVPSTLNFRPGLAVGWQMLPNTTIIFNIRRNVTFHNGDPMTPYDVWWSLQRALPVELRSALFNSTYINNATANPHGYRWCEEDGDRESYVWLLLESVKDIRMADIGFWDNTTYTGDNATAGDGWDEIVVEFSEPFAPGLSLFSYASTSIVNWKVATALGPHDMKFAPVGAGTGPFAFKSWVLNYKVTLDKWPNYWGQVAHVDHVEYQSILSASSRTLAITTGMVDLLYPEAGDWPTLKADPNIVTWQEAGLGTRYIGFQCMQNVTGRMNGIMSNSTFRKALSYAINYDEIINGEQFLNGLGTRLTQPVVPAISWAYNSSIKPENEGGILPYYNLTKANEILDSMGLVDSDSNGFRNINSTHDIKLIYGYNKGNALRERVGYLLQDAFAEIGIDLDIQGDTWEIFLYDKLVSGAYDLWMLGWGPDYIDPDTYFYPLFHSDFIWSTNAAGVNSSTVDYLLKSARSETNQTIRAQMYKNATNILINEYVWGWCYIPDNTYAWRTTISGFTHSPLLEFDDLEYVVKTAGAGAGIPLEVVGVVIGVIVAVAVIGSIAYWRKGAAA
ncbi:MAG: ABC transporter substrate-binding protein [Candidatus Odinarchaeota archaeon]